MFKQPPCIHEFKESLTSHKSVNCDESGKSVAYCSIHASMVVIEYKLIQINLVAKILI